MSEMFPLCWNSIWPEDGVNAVQIITLLFVCRVFVWSIDRKQEKSIWMFDLTVRKIRFVVGTEFISGILFLKKWWSVYQANKLLLRMKWSVFQGTGGGLHFSAWRRTFWRQRSVSRPHPFSLSPTVTSWALLLQTIFHAVRLKTKRLYGVMSVVIIILVVGGRPLSLLQCSLANPTLRCPPKTPPPTALCTGKPLVSKQLWTCLRRSPAGHCEIGSCEFAAFALLPRLLSTDLSSSSSPLQKWLPSSKCLLLFPPQPSLMEPPHCWWVALFSDEPVVVEYTVPQHPTQLCRTASTLVRALGGTFRWVRRTAVQVWFAPVKISFRLGDAMVLLILRNDCVVICNTSRTRTFASWAESGFSRQMPKGKEEKTCLLHFVLCKWQSNGASIQVKTCMTHSAEFMHSVNLNENIGKSLSLSSLVFMWDRPLNSCSKRAQKSLHKLFSHRMPFASQHFVDSEVG